MSYIELRVGLDLEMENSEVELGLKLVGIKVRIRDLWN